MTVPGKDRGNSQELSSAVAVFFPESREISPVTVGRRRGVIHEPDGRANFQRDSSGRGLLVTCHALLGCRRRRIQIRPSLNYFIMTTAAISMEGLLVGQNRRLRAAFKFELWNLRQELRLAVCTRVTIRADIHCRRVRILLKQLSR